MSRKRQQACRDSSVTDPISVVSPAPTPAGAEGTTTEATSYSVSPINDKNSTQRRIPTDRDTSPNSCRPLKRAGQTTVPSTIRIPARSALSAEAGHISSNANANAAYPISPRVCIRKANTATHATQATAQDQPLLRRIRKDNEKDRQYAGRYSEREQTKLPSTMPSFPPDDPEVVASYTIIQFDRLIALESRLQINGRHPEELASTRRVLRHADTLPRDHWREWASIEQYVDEAERRLQRFEEKDERDDNLDAVVGSSTIGFDAEEPPKSGVADSWQEPHKQSEDDRPPLCHSYFSTSEDVHGLAGHQLLAQCDPRSLDDGSGQESVSREASPMDGSQRPPPETAAAASPSTQHTVVDLAAAPPEPACAMDMLVRQPWSIPEIYLLVDVIANYPPQRHGWEYVTDVYNFVLMFRPVQKWLLEKTLNGRVEWQERVTFWTAFWSRMHNDWGSGPDGSLRVVGDAKAMKAFLDSCEAEATRVVHRERRKAQKQPARAPFGSKDAHLEAQAHAQASTSGLLSEAEARVLLQTYSNGEWYDVRFPAPPLSYKPELARAWSDLMAQFAKAMDMKDDKERSDVDQLMLRIYKLLEPKYPVRAAWECWHRWCVPLSRSVSKEDDHSITRTSTGGIQICRVPKMQGTAEALASLAVGKHGPSFPIRGPESQSSTSGNHISELDPVWGNLAGNVAHVPGTYPEEPGMQRDYACSNPSVGIIGFMAAQSFASAVQRADAKPAEPVQDAGAREQARTLDYLTQDRKAQLKEIAVLPDRLRGRLGVPSRSRREGEMRRLPNVPPGTFGSTTLRAMLPWFVSVVASERTLSAIVGIQGGESMAEFGERTKSEESSWVGEESWKLPLHLRKLDVRVKPDTGRYAL